MMRMEITESRFVKELTLRVADLVSLVIFIYVVKFAERSAEENASRKKVQVGWHCRILAG